MALKSDIEYGVEWALTVTLPKRITMLYTAEGQYTRTFVSYLKLLSGVGAFHTSVIELTKNMDIHYHAQVKLPKSVKNSNKKLIDLFRMSKTFGYVCVKPITSEYWLNEYMQEDLWTTKGLMSDYPCFNPVIHDDYNIQEKIIEKVPIEEWEPLIDDEWGFIDEDSFDDSNVIPSSAEESQCGTVGGS